MPKKRAQQNPPQVQPIQEKKVNLTDISPALSDNCRVFFNEISKLNLPIQCPAVSDAMSKTIISMQESIRKGQHISPTVFDMELSRNVLDVLGEIGSSVDKSQSAFLAAFSRYSAETLNSYGEQIHNFLQLVPEMQGVSPQVVSDLRQLERTITTSNYAIGDLFQSVNSASGKASLNPALFEAAQKAAVEVRNKTVDMVVHSGSELSQTAMVLARKARESLSEYTAQYDIVRELDRELEQTRRLPSSSERDLKISELSQRLILSKKVIEQDKQARQDQEWRDRQNKKIAFVQDGCQILNSITDIALVGMDAFYSGKKLSQEELEAIQTKKRYIKIARIAVRGVSSIATIVYKFINRGTFALASGPLAPYVAVFGVCATLVDVYQSIMGLYAPEEPTNSEMLQEFSRQISALSENITHGFEVISQRIAQLDEYSFRRFQVLAHMLEQMNANILQQLTDVKQSVEQIKENLNQIAVKFSAQLQAFQEETQVQLREIYDQDYLKIRDEAHLFALTVDAEGETTMLKVNKIFSRFCTRAVKEASSETLAGSSSGRVFDERLWERAAEFNINPLFAYARSMLAPIGILQDSHFRLINPLVWEEAVTSMLSFAYCTPSFMLYPERKREIEGLISAGQSVKEFIITLKTHPELFQKLFQSYCSSLEKVSEALIQCVSDHLSIDEVKKAMEKKVKETWPLHQKLRKREAKLAQKRQALPSVVEPLQNNIQSLADLKKRLEESQKEIDQLEQKLSAMADSISASVLSILNPVENPIILFAKARAAYQAILPCLHEEQVLSEKISAQQEFMAQLKKEIVYQEEQIKAVKKAISQEPSKDSIEMIEEYFEKFMDHDLEERNRYAVKVLEQESIVTSPLHSALAQLEESYHILLSFVELAFKDDEELQTAIRTQLWDRLAFKKYMEAYRVYKLGGEDSVYQDSIYTYLHKHFLKTLDDLQQLVMERAAAMYLSTRVGDFVPSHPSIDATLEKLDVFLQLFSLKSKTPLQCLESQKVREQARGARHWYLMSFFTRRSHQPHTFRRVSESDSLALLQLPAKRSASESPPRLQDTPLREMSDEGRQLKRRRDGEDLSLPIAVQQPDQKVSGVFPAAVVKSPTTLGGVNPMSSRFFPSVPDRVSSPRPEVDGLTYEPILGDGHCFYRAVTLFLTHGEDVTLLRNIVAANLEANKDRYRDFIPLAEEQTIEGYINAILGREWAGQVEQNILMRWLNRPIVIIGPEGDIRNVDDVKRARAERNAGEPIFVYFNGRDHYDALIVKDGFDGNSMLNRLLPPEVPRARAS